MIQRNETTYYGEVLWSPEDIMDLVPHMTRDQAERWLRDNEQHIQDTVKGYGRNALTVLLRDAAVKNSQAEESTEESKTLIVTMIDGHFSDVTVFAMEEEARLSFARMHQDILRDIDVGETIAWNDADDFCIYRNGLPTYQQSIRKVPVK